LQNAAKIVELLFTPYYIVHNRDIKQTE